MNAPEVDTDDERDEEEAATGPAKPNVGKAGAPFERLAAALHKKLDPGADVRWNETINGAQIDVVVRGSVGGTPIVVIVECRDYEKKLGIDHVRRLVAVKEEVGANKAILVTRTGFTKPALKRAAHVGIDACVLRPAQDADHPGPGTPLRRLNIRIDLHGVAIENVEFETVDGQRIPGSPMDRIEDADGNTEFIDRIVEGWLYSDAGRGQTGKPLVLELTPHPKLLRDEDTCFIRHIRCTTRATVFPGITEYLWQAPAEWVFVKHGVDGTSPEPRFFEFDDLQALAETFRE